MDHKTAGLTGSKEKTNSHHVIIHSKTRFVNSFPQIFLQSGNIAPLFTVELSKKYPFSTGEQVKRRIIIIMQSFKTAAKTSFVGFLFTVIAGSLLHFAFAASGGNTLIGAFTPVNESVWEHLKLLLIPAVAFSAVEFFVYGKEPAGILCGKITVSRDRACGNSHAFLYLYGNRRAELSCSRYRGIYRVGGAHILSFLRVREMSRALFRTGEYHRHQPCRGHHHTVYILHLHPSDVRAFPRPGIGRFRNSGQILLFNTYR